MNAPARIAAASLVALILSAGLAAGDVTVDGMFSSRMVLQRDMPVAVWGTAKAGETVKVEFRDQRKQARAGEDGKWDVRLDAMKVGGPATMTVRDTAGEPVVFDDVLVGEVWFGSGQSNMAGETGGYAGNDPELAKMLAGGPYPGLRLYTGRDGWKQADESSAARFSALLFSFGHCVHKRLDVPVGLIVRAIGGTPSGSWLTTQMIADDPASVRLLKMADDDEMLNPEKAQADYMGKLAEWERAAKAYARPRPPFRPGDLYNSHVKPVLPYTIRGVLWDQGEGGTAIPAIDQYTLMGALIGGWRKAWGQGEFPFLYVQKPSGGGCAWDYDNPVTSKAGKFAALPAQPKGDGDYRELHIRIMKHPNTAMVTASDLGPGIHPMNKSGYGARACRVAMGFVYGKDVEYYGPVYESHAVENGAIRVKFSHAAGGLAVPAGQKLQGFEIAGSNGNYVWADAKIDGHSVLVSNKEVAAPTAVRYGWSWSHPWANLFNAAHLPALTFQAVSTGLRSCEKHGP